MLGKISIGLGVVIALFLLFVASRPAAFHVERSASIAAPPEVVFAEVNDFHSWQAWSPWDKLDPGMRRSYSGAPSGVGAVYGWAGSGEVGEGQMTIEKSEKPSSIRIALVFLKPFAANDTTLFEFTPSASGTKVTWAMDGQNGFMSKAVSLFMDMDKMVGGDFERGLASLKQISEAKASSPATATAATTAEGT
jgi:hypothetical protein